MFDAESKAGEQPKLRARPASNIPVNGSAAASRKTETTGAPLKLIVQPTDGAAPLLKAIKQAKKSIEIVIFRFDQTEVAHALEDAAERGVFVHALIAFTNR